MATVQYLCVHSLFSIMTFDFLFIIQRNRLFLNTGSFRVSHRQGKRKDLRCSGLQQTLARYLLTPRREFQVSPLVGGASHHRRTVEDQDPSPRRRGEREQIVIYARKMEVFPAKDTEKMRAHLRGMQWKVAELEKICRRKEREGGPREMKRERE